MAADFYYPTSKNAVQKTLSAQLLNTAGVGDAITFADVDGVQNKPGVLVINRVDANGVATPSSREFISYSGTSGTTVLIETRNVDGAASAKTHNVGSIVEFNPDVVWGQRVIDQILEEHGIDGTHDATKIVKIAGTQTITGAKTFASLKVDDAGIDIEQIATPASPSAGRNKLYPKSGGKYYSLDESGTELALATESYVAANGGKSSLYQNSLINGGFDVWQRGVTFTPNDDVFTADRWNLLTETNGAWTIARDTDVPASLGFKYSAKLTNVTLNNQVALVQILENVDSMKLNGQAVSLSFYAKTSGTEIANLRASVISWSSTADTVTSDVIGTWASDGTDPTLATNWTYEVAGANKALTGSWARYTIENVTIDTASMANVAVLIWLDDGTVAANDDFWITGVQLNQGITAATWIPASFDSELRACQRYCFVPDASQQYSHISNGYTLNSTTARVTLHFPVKMRTLPTMTVTASDWLVEDAGATPTCTVVAFSTDANSTTSPSIDLTVASGLTTGRGIAWRPSAANKVAIFSAEL